MGPIRRRRSRLTGHGSPWAPRDGTCTIRTTARARVAVHRPPKGAELRLYQIALGALGAASVAGANIPVAVASLGLMTAIIVLASHRR